MADLSKLMKKRLGAPPPPEEASETLQAPEIAPAAPIEPEAHVPPERVEARRRAARQPREDGRSLRRTGRTIQFATRVKESFDRDVRRIAKSEGLLLAEVLENAVECYKEKLAARKQQSNS